MTYRLEDDRGNAMMYVVPSQGVDLDRALAHGTLPGIYAEPDPELRAADLRAYVDTYLREEIQAESLVRNVGGYARLLELVAASSGRC